MAKDPKKIDCTCHPFPSHLRPHAPLIKALGEQGHQVRLATSEKLARTARHHGITHLPAGQDWTADPAIRSAVARLLLEEGNDAFCEASFTHLARAARGMAHDLMEKYRDRDQRPDLIVTDIAEFGGAIVGEKLGIPVITSDNGLLRLVHDLHRPVIKPILDEIRDEFGLPPEPEDAPASFKTVLHAAPKELLIPDLQLPGLVTYEHTDPERIGARLPDGVFEGDGPKVVAFFGNLGAAVPEWELIFRHSNEIAIEAMANGPYDGLIIVGRHNAPKYADVPGSEELGLRAVPARGAPNVMVVEETDLPHALGRSDLAMGHAGWGSGREMLTAEVPTLWMPNQTDQPDNARRFEANGLGLMLEPRSADARDVAARLEELAARQPEFADNLARLKERWQELPSVPELTESVTRSLELGDLEFRGLKGPGSDPGDGGGAPTGPRPDGPITITGPVG